MGHAGLRGKHKQAIFIEREYKDRTHSKISENSTFEMRHAFVIPGLNLFVFVQK